MLATLKGLAIAIRPLLFFLESQENLNGHLVILTKVMSDISRDRVD